MAAFAAVPEVLQNGKIVDVKYDYKGKQEDRVVIAAPITLGGKTAFVGAVIQKTVNSDSFYLHEVEIKDAPTFRTTAGIDSWLGSDGASSLDIILDRLAKDKTLQEENSEIKFSMQDSVEETDKLLAIHNLTGSQLNGVLELGGFPMPSIAVLKATQGHDRYGDVSVVFDKATIDPKTNSRNKVYGGDAWTPNFPAVEYEVNSKAAEKIRTKYYELARRKGYDFVRPMYTIANTLEDELNRSGGVGAIISDLEDDTRMMNVFLEDSGAGPVEDIISRKTTRIPDETVQRYDTLADAVGRDAFEELRTQNGESPVAARKRWLSEYKDRLVQGYTEFLKKFDFTDEQIQNVLNAETNRSLTDMAIKIRNYLKDGAETVTESVDTSATEQAIRKKTDTAKYREWLHGLLDDAEGGKGIYNGKERYTASGNKRSFNATHWEMTLENIVRAMRADTKKGGGAFGDSGLFGLATKDYSSLDEIRADANRLRKENDSEYEAQKTTFSNEYQATPSLRWTMRWKRLRTRCALARRRPALLVY